MSTAVISAGQETQKRKGVWLLHILDLFVFVSDSPYWVNVNKEPVVLLVRAESSNSLQEGRVSVVEVGVGDERGGF